jgi:RNA recognition motif-containing protein
MHEPSGMSGHNNGGPVDGWKLFVGHIPESASVSDLRALFQPFGEIVDIVILHDRYTRQSRGSQQHRIGAEPSCVAVTAADSDAFILRFVCYFCLF